MEPTFDHLTDSWTTAFLSLEVIEPNDWNPNRMDAFQFRKERESILRFGFVDPMTVRAIRQDDDTYRMELIDGEHRWKVLRDLEQEYHAGDLDPVEIHPSLIPFLDHRRYPCTILERDEIDAQALTLVLNGTHGESDPLRLAAVLERVRDRHGDDGEIRGLAMSAQSITHTLAFLREGWEDRVKDEASSYTTDDPTKPVEVKVAFSPDAWEVVVQAIQNLPPYGQNERPIAFRLGDCFELLAADFLAGQPNP